MEKNQIEQILEKSSNKKICIIGDLMLDRYMFGDVNRISPEAPVQVFDITKTENKLGGAANVALNIKTLGCNPFLIGVIGNDDAGKLLKDEMDVLNISTTGLLVENHRPTTSKTRVISEGHHLLRLDSESKNDITAETEEEILQKINLYKNDIECIILQDYNKGVLTKKIIESVISLANSNQIKILVDPKFENFFEYKNSFIFKPNKKELEDAFGRKAKSADDLDDMAKKLASQLNCENLVLTLGEQGMRIYEKLNGEVKIDSIKTKARSVADVSGAGDTVIATIAAALTGGANVYDAVILSNIAAGIVVEEVGIVPIYKDVLLKSSM